MLSQLQGHRYVGFIALVAAIFIYAGADEVRVPDPGFQYDKLGHFLVFGLIATALFRSYTFPKSKKARWLRILWVTLIVSAIGALDEMRQFYADGRMAEVADWVADTVGALVASFVYAFWGWYRNFLEMPISFRRKSRLQL